MAALTPPAQSEASQLSRSSCTILQEDPCSFTPQLGRSCFWHPDSDFEDLWSFINLKWLFIYFFLFFIFLFWGIRGQTATTGPGISLGLIPSAFCSVQFQSRQTREPALTWFTECVTLRRCRVCLGKCPRKRGPSVQITITLLWRLLQHPVLPAGRK